MLNNHAGALDSMRSTNLYHRDDSEFVPQSDIALLSSKFFPNLSIPKNNIAHNLDFHGCIGSSLPAMKTPNQGICSESAAKVIVSADQPHSVQLVNEEFKALFGIDSDVDVETISNSRLLADLRNHVLHMLQQAVEGRTTKGTALLHTSSGANTPVKVTVEPILMPAVGRITSLLLNFSPVQPAPQYAENRTFHRQLSHISPTSEAPSAPPSFRTPTPPQLQSDSPAHGTQAPSSPRPDSPRWGSDLTPNAIAAVAHLPMREAAARLGRSVSTLKAACRQVGIPRWPRAAPGSEARGAAMAAAAAPSLREGGAAAGEGTDIAYARRLFRKYADLEARRRRRAGAK
jgi:hypothetical protein